MNINILYPLVYLLCGVAIGRTSLQVKGLASSLLTKLIIPFVIIYNISSSITEMVPIMIGMIVVMTAMLVLSRIFVRDPVENLCFCYLNIGWLGLPIASALFGNTAATVVLSAYIGSSIFGNLVSVSVMSSDENCRKSLKNLLKAPPIIALAIGLICVPVGPSLVATIEPIYSLMKFLMSFLGMAILGIWLSQSTFDTKGFKKSLIEFICRASLMTGIVFLFIYFCKYLDLQIVTENSLALYLICLLPPAANIIVLETHYLKSGRSATMIAWGTCISLCAITVFSVTTIYFDMTR